MAKANASPRISVDFSDYSAPDYTLTPGYYPVTVIGTTLSRSPKWYDEELGEGDPTFVGVYRLELSLAIDDETSKFNGRKLRFGVDVYSSDAVRNEFHLRTSAKGNPYDARGFFIEALRALDIDPETFAGFETDDASELINMSCVAHVEVQVTDDVDPETGDLKKYPRVKKLVKRREAEFDPYK